MKFRGVVLSLVVLCCALPSTVLAGQHAVRPGVQSRFGIPFPNTRDPQAWQQWRQQIRARLDAGRATARANATSDGSAGIIETLAGAAPFQKPVNAVKTGFGQIEAMTEDAGGNLYVASCDLGVVLKIDTSSNTTVYAGTPLPVGPAISSGDGGPATSAHIACPAGLALDSSENLYVTDAYSATVRKVDAATGIIQTVAGTPGKYGHAGDGGPGTSALLEYPTGLALDGQGNLFIVDQFYLWRLNLTTGVIQTFAGSGFISNPCLPSATTTCPALQTTFYFDGPEIAVHGGLLYAIPYSIYYAGGNDLNSSIVSINLSSGSVQLLAGGGARAGTPTSTYPAIGTEAYIHSVAVDGAGNVFFSGQYQASNGGAQPNLNPYVDGIFELMASDNTIRGLAGTNTPSNNTNGDGGPATNAEIAFTGVMCLSAKGDVIFDDGSFNIRTFPIGGNLSRIAGDGWPNFFGDNGPAQHAGLDQPTWVTTDAKGNVYVADYGNERVRKIDAASGVITTIAGGVLPPNAEAELTASYPSAVAIDGNNHLYVRIAGAVETIDLSTGAISTLVPNAYLKGPLAFDGNTTLYYSLSTAPSSTVWMVDVTTGATRQIAGAPNTPGPTWDGGPALQAGLYDVEGLALDGQNLYLADSGYQNIRMIDLNTGIISKIGGMNPGGGSLAGYSGDGGPATAATFNRPAGLAYDGAGHLTIADSGNHVLRQIDLATNIVTTIAGNHTPGFGGDGGSPAAAMLYDPQAAVYDPSGNLLIADTENYRVRRVVLHPTKLLLGISGAGTFEPGSSLSLKASFSHIVFGIAPTGTVDFLSGSVSLGTSTIEPATDGSGSYTASLSIPSLPAGVTSVTAQYSGDANYAAGAITLTLQQLGPFYTLSAKPSSLTIPQGSSGSVTFTVAPVNGFNEQVSFACDPSSLPKGVTCSFSPASVTPSGSPVTTTLTVQTTGASIAAIDRSNTKSSPWLPRGGAMLALVVLLVPPMRRKIWLAGASVLLFAVFLGGISACGGNGGNSSSGSSVNPNATPPGSYLVHVNSSVGSQSGIVPVTVSLTVTE